MVTISTMKPIVELFRLESLIQQLKAQGQFQMALQYYDQVIHIKQGINNRLGLAKTIAEKAFLLEQLGRRSDALQMYQTARQIAADSPNDEFLSLIAQRIHLLG